MTALHLWAARRPLLTAGLVAAAALAYFLAPIVLSADRSVLFGHGRMDQSADSFAPHLWPEIALAAVLMLVVVALGWIREVGLTQWPSLRGWLLTIPILLYTLFLALLPVALLMAGDAPATTAAAMNWVLVGIAAFTALIVGFFEEVLFRGVLLHGLRARLSAIVSVLVGAAIFGAFHLVNWVTGQPLEPTIAQALGAAGGGVLYGALVLWTGSLWPAILLHGFWDASITFLQTVIATTETVDPADTTAHPLMALFSFEMVYGLILLAFWWRFRGRRSTAPETDRV